MTRWLAGVLAAGVLLLVLAPPPRSGANFTAQTTRGGNVFTADSVTRYLRLFSQGSDPAGLTGYATKNLSNPPVVAATGTDGTLQASLGGWKNGGTMNRVFTIQAQDTLPAASITVTASIAPITSVTAATISAVGATGGTASATLTAGQKRQVNLTLARSPGNNVMRSQTLTLTVTYPGYTGGFLAYPVPLQIWDGNGAGP